MPVALPLIEISVMAILWLCIALALIIVTIMGKLGELLRPIPVVGSHLAGWVHSAAQGITGVLGSAESGIDSAIGASWHQLARLFDGWLHMLEAEAGAIAHIAEYVAQLVYAHSGLRTLVHAIERTAHGIEHGVKDLTRQWHGIEARVGKLEREITNGIGHDLRIGLQKVEKTVSGVVHGTIPALQRTVDGVSGELTQLENFVKALPGTSYLDWVGGIVAAGLAAIGMEWLICRSRNGVNGKSGCNLWNDIEGLLGAALVTGLALDLPTLIAEAQKVTPGIIAEIESLAGIGG